MFATPSLMTSLQDIARALFSLLSLCQASIVHDLSGHDFSNKIDDTYSQIVHWKPNFFKVPSGASGKHFVGELARLFEAFAAGLAFEAFATMTLPTLMPQKLHAKSKACDHISCLKCRLTL